MISSITPAQFNDLYNTQIKRDFASSERRPLKSIQKLFRQGLYTCQVMLEGDDIMAYACFLQAEGQGSVLLDYFAVSPTKRGAGLGSRFLGELREKWPVSGIIIECEMPSKAKNEEDRTIRQKRIAFYLRNGALMTNVGWRAFSVDYNLLWLPIVQSLEAVDVGAAIEILYRQSLPDYLAGKVTKVYHV